jgi:small subunit ribosomal protein S17
MTGIVVSNKMQKCLVVQVISTVMHSKYKKPFKKRKKYKASCSDSSLFVPGSSVSLVSTRPKSKDIRWKVLETVA